MALTGSGNTRTPDPAAARDSSYIPVEYTVPANVNNKTYTDPFFRVPSYPGNVKLRCVGAWVMNGNTASTLSTTVTLGIYNDSNAEDAIASKTLAAADIVACAGTNYVASALTLSSSTSDRSTVSGMTATEDDINVAPGDVLFVKIVADAGSTVTAGTRIQAVFRPVDVAGN